NSRASALIDQPCLYRTCNSIQSAPDFTRGLLCGRWLGHHQLPTSEAPSPFPADRCPVQPRSLCTFRDQVIALFVIPYTAGALSVRGTRCTSNGAVQSSSVKLSWASQADDQPVVLGWPADCRDAE